LLLALDALAGYELMQHQHAIMLHQALDQGQLSAGSQQMVC